MFTRLEERLLKFITAYIAREGHSPTLAQMGDALVITSRGTLDRNAEVTLKRLRHHGDRIELIPDNPVLAPMIYPTLRVHIQGVVIGQVRIY